VSVPWDKEEGGIVAKASFSTAGNAVASDSKRPAGKMRGGP